MNNFTEKYIEQIKYAAYIDELQKIAFLNIFKSKKVIPVAKEIVKKVITKKPENIKFLIPGKGFQTIS